MTAERPNTSDQQHDLDVLIGRIIDGEARSVDLDAFTERAVGVSDSWRSLAEQQRDRGLILRSMAAELAVAERIGLPGSTDAAELPLVVTTPMTRFVRPVLAYTGWAAAITLVFIVGFAQPVDSPIRVINREAVQDHIVDDVEIRKLDPMTIAINPRPDGLWDVIVIERSEHRWVLDAFDPRWEHLEGEGGADVEAETATDL